MRCAPRFDGKPDKQQKDNDAENLLLLFGQILHRRDKRMKDGSEKVALLLFGAETTLHARPIGPGTLDTPGLTDNVSRFSGRPAPQWKPQSGNGFL